MRKEDRLADIFSSLREEEKITEMRMAEVEIYSPEYERMYNSLWFIRSEIDMIKTKLIKKEN